MTLISMFGVAIGVAALVIVLSIMGGFEKNLRNRMFKGLPHIEILAENALAGFSLKDMQIENLYKELSKKALIEPFIRADVVAKNKKFILPITLFGVEPRLGGKLWGFSDNGFESSTQTLLAQKLLILNTQIFY